VDQKPFLPGLEVPLELIHKYRFLKYITPANITDFDTAADSRITAVTGVADGLAELDSNGKVPISQISLYNTVYCGIWDIFTNTPTLSDGAADELGCYRVVSIGGTRNLGSENIT
jgi:hypothetical protein